MRAHTGATTEWTYTGEQQDLNGLVYLRARHYDPGSGRFLSRDPFGGFVFAPQSLNRYAYVINNPVNWIDLWGLRNVEGTAFVTPTPTPRDRVWVCRPVTPAGCENGHWLDLSDQDGWGWLGDLWSGVSDFVVSVVTCDWCQSAAAGAATTAFCLAQPETHVASTGAGAAVGVPEAGPLIALVGCGAVGVGAGFGFNILFP